MIFHQKNLQTLQIFLKNKHFLILNFRLIIQKLQKKI